MLKILPCFLPLLVVLLSGVSGAHDVDEATDPYDKIERYGRLLEKISRLESLEGADQGRPAVPVIRIQGENFYLNTAFYSLVEEVVRLYQDEIHQVCAECVQPSVDDVSEQAQALVAKGWLKNFGEKLGKQVLVRYGGEFVDLGSRYGTAAGLLKVAGELAEDAMLVVFKIPGAHFLCEVITMGIAYYSGGLLTTYRTWSQAKQVDKSSVLQLVRLAATSWVMRRSLKRISLDVGPVELIDLEETEHINHSEMKHWLIHELDEEPKIEKFLNKLVKVSQSYDDKIADLEEKLNGAEEGQRLKYEKKIKYLRKRISRLTQVKRKVFEGRRLGLTFYLFKRNRALTLYNDEIEMNKYLKGTQLWMIPLTSNYTQPGLNWSESLKSSVSGFLAASKQDRSPRETSPVDKILLDEAQEQGVAVDRARRMFEDISLIFQTQTSRRQRYARLLLMQGALGEFLPKLVKSFVSTYREQLSEQDTSFRNLKRTTSLQWMSGQVTYYTNQYLDYLRTVSLVKGKKSPFHFEEALAKDYFLKILKSLDTVSQLRSASDYQEIDLIREQLKIDLEVLKASMFWYEKRAGHRLLPLKETFAKLFGLGKYNIGRKRVQCEQLYY